MVAARHLRPTDDGEGPGAVSRRPECGSAPPPPRPPRHASSRRARPHSHSTPPHGQRRRAGGGLSADRSAARPGQAPQPRPAVAIDGTAALAPSRAAQRWPVRDCRRPAYAAPPRQYPPAPGRAERRPQRGRSPPPQPRSQYGPLERTATPSCAQRSARPRRRSEASRVSERARNRSRTRHFQCSTWNTTARRRARERPARPHPPASFVPRGTARGYAAPPADVPRGTSGPVRGLGQIPSRHPRTQGPADSNIAGREGTCLA